MAFLFVTDKDEDFEEDIEEDDIADNKDRETRKNHGFEDEQLYCALTQLTASTLSFTTLRKGWI